MTSLEQRVEKLERRNRWLTRYFLGSLGGICLFAAFGADGDNKDMAQVIRATKFELVNDDGKILSEWGRTGFEEGSVHKHLRLSKTNADRLTGLRFFDDRGKDCVFIGTDGFWGEAAVTHIHDSGEVGFVDMAAGDGQYITVGHFDKDFSGWDLDQTEIRCEHDGVTNYTVPPRQRAKTP
jgi:hypothetical protein